MANKPGDLFFRTFKQEVRDLVVRAVQRAYVTACDVHQSARGKGSCEATFGYCLYHYLHAEFEQAEQTGADNLQVIAHGQTFRLAVGEFTLAWYRIGRTGDEDVWSAFPSNDSGAGAMAHANQYLPGFEPEVDQARNLVIGHMGNAEDGLGALSLCVPTKEKNGVISEWGYTEELWRREVDASGFHGVAMTNAPEEVIPEVHVPRKKIKVENGRQG